MEFSGKKIVITGGLGGIGFETSSQLIQEGIECLVIIDVLPENDKKLTQLKGLNKNVKIYYYKIDISNETQVNDAFKDIRTKLQTIDIFFGVAAILDERRINETVNINLLGTIYTTTNVMKLMSKSSENGRGGVIAVVSSVAGVDPFYAFPVYVATKHALVGYMRSFSHEYHYNAHGIKFITVCPSQTLTPLAENLAEKAVTADIGIKFVEDLKDFNSNSASEMGKYLIDAVKIGENGSVWIADKKLQLLNFPTYFTI